MRGYFIERYNRFLADIETESGEAITAYCPATGRMTTCLENGAPCEYLRVENPDRKLNYDWWSIKTSESWIIIDTRPANRWLYWNRTTPWLPDDWERATWVPEPTLPDGGRLDYRLEWPERPDAWVEIKSVTWCENGVGYFPDAPTKRGRRHLRELTNLASEGHETYVVLISMRSDVERIHPGSEVDPEFAADLRTAHEQGVNLLGLKSDVEDRSLQLTGTVPVIPDP